MVERRVLVSELGNSQRSVLIFHKPLKRTRIQLVKQNTSDGSLTFFYNAKVVGLRLYNSLELLNTSSNFPNLILVKLRSRFDVLYGPC